MRKRFRGSFAGRLLAGVLVLVLTVLVGISAFLIISRDQQTRGSALSNADNRAAVVRQLLEKLTAPQGLEVARELAAAPPLATALSGAAPATDVPALLPAGSRINPPHQYAVITGRDGAVLYSSVPGNAYPAPDASLPSIRAALSGHKDVSGVEILKDGSRQAAAFDSAEPVVSSGTVVGAVVLVAPLAEQLIQFAPVVGFVTAFVPADGSSTIARLNVRQSAAVPPPSDVIDAIKRGDAVVHGTYVAPTEDGSTTDVAGSFVPVNVPGSDQPGGYVGVEAPLSLFAGDTRSDEVTLLVISGFVILVTAALVILFVDRFIRRPVARLERGVARIAGGDYTTDIAVTSTDELGSLAKSVNQMRREIASYVTQVEEARARLDASVERLGGVSRALTTTTAGIQALQQAVVGAAAEIAGAGAAAMLLARVADHFELSTTRGVEGGTPTLDSWGAESELLAGRAVRVDHPAPGWRAGGLLAVPMFYQEQVTGALVVITRQGHLPSDSDVRSLAVLANSAAIALENTRLFEQERETLRRLRELDAMKSDFLATVQHELRTPLTAILGMADLMEMCWEVWDDAGKMDALHDVQVAARNLYEIVETMIDFTLLEADTVGLNPSNVDVRAVVEQAVTAVEERNREGLPVKVDIEVLPGVEVYADPNRLRQVLRALVDNAVKFTPEGGHVEVLGDSNGRDGMVRIDVVDTGVGIPVEALDRIFERFYQVDNTATRKYGGTGMGLALVRRLVEAHGATVVVESHEGTGTRVTLVWPARADVAAGEAAAIAHDRGEA
ncbi:MAG TPA: ATP-binding protein [Candidatus Dormibacteraeota bacterium]|nr:ATP-binding protein [Candidatus Dormibacteraeota bacterium]